MMVQIAADKQRIAADKQRALEVEAQQQKIPLVNIDSIDFGACREEIKNPPQFCEFEFVSFQHEGWLGEETIAEEARVCNTGSMDKQKRHILFVPAGMGGGKSRVLTELHTFIEPELDEGSILIELRVNFENGKSAKEHERSTSNRADVVEKALLDRIMYHLIGGDKEFVYFCQNTRWRFNLPELVKTIQRHVETVEKKKVYVLVSVDGAHNLDQRDGEYIDEGIYSEGDRKGWYKRSALREVLVVLQSVLHGVGRVMCAVSSTVTLPLDAVITGSNVLLKKFIRPPALTSLPDEIQNTTVLRHKGHFMALFGEHPRTMEFLLNIQKTEIPEIMDVCTEQLRMRYASAVKLSPTELSDLLRYSLSATCTKTSPVGNRVVDDMLSRGLLTLTNKTLRISPALMYALWKDDSLSILQDWKPYTNDGTGRFFEEFIGYVQCVRSKVFSGEVPLKEFLHGVRWCTEPKSTSYPNDLMKVKPVPLRFLEAKHQLHTCSEKNAAPLSDDVPQTKDGCLLVDTVIPTKIASISLQGHCVMNADGASAGDLFFPLTMVEEKGDKTIHVVTQAKHTESDVGEVSPYEKASEKNAEVAATSGDVYLFVTKKRVEDDQVLKKAVQDGVRAGIVDAQNFQSHFGPFSTNFTPSLQADEDDLARLTCRYCGKGTTTKGQAFTPSSLNNHRKQCKDRSEIV